MTRQTPIAPAAIALTLFAALITAFAAGCADSSSAGGRPSDDFEVRAMIAADRQQMQATDERLRRMESQIQDLAHSPPSGGPEGNAAPAAEQALPPAAAPAVQSAPPSAPPAMGAPMAPAGGETVPPGASAVPPSAPPGEAAAPSTAEPGNSERTTIASAPGREAGGAPPSGEENPAQAGTAAGAAPEGAANDEGGSEEGGTENGNPEAPPPPGAPASAAAPAAPRGEEAAPPDGGSAPAAAPAAPAGEEGAPPGGEEVASAPASTPPENAPAVVPAARWPEDLARESQSTSNSKGGAGKLFRSGMDAMKSRDYSAAVDRFGTLQKKFPHSDLTEPAAYFSASALNEMGKYDQAILQYNDLVMRYPGGKYASEALLRESQAFVQINDKVDARLTLQKLINEHAGTPQAATAGAMMKTLESN